MNAVYGIVRWEFAKSGKGRHIHTQSERERVRERDSERNSARLRGLVKGRMWVDGGCWGGGERLLVNVIRYWGRWVPGVMNACQRWDMMRGLPCPSLKTPTSGSPLFNLSRFPVFASSQAPEAVVRSSINAMWKFVGNGRNLAILFVRTYRCFKILCNYFCCFCIFHI